MGSEPIATLSPFVASVVLATVLSGAGQPDAPPEMNDLVFALPDGGEMRYTLSTPADADPAVGDAPRPLVLVLHPGGARGGYYGGLHLRQTFEPALRALGAVMVAPDAPGGRWSHEAAGRAVMALLDEIVETHDIDPSRVLATGFSLGGRGTWFFAARRPDFFTGAIPVAGPVGDEPVDALSGMPVHVIHSRADDVVQFGPAEAAVRTLEAAGATVELTVLEDAGHYDMGAYVPAIRAAGEWMRARWSARRGRPE